MIEADLVMNRTVGMVMIIAGIFFGICGVLSFTSVDTSHLSAGVSVDTALFLGGGFTLFVVGILLMNDVHVSPPGSLMVRRGQFEA